MATARDVRVNEVAFCAEVKAWADALFAQHPEWPFASAHIEQYGPGSNKRQDIRILLKPDEKPVLSGEVKMPGTPEGRSPYSPELMRDAFEKALDKESFAKVPVIAAGLNQAPSA